MKTEIQKIIYPEATAYPNLTDDELIIKLLDEIIMSFYFTPSTVLNSSEPLPCRIKQALQVIAHAKKSGKKMPLTPWLAEYIREHGFLDKQ